jgi:hypothetical protein
LDQVRADDERRARGEQPETGASAEDPKEEPKAEEGAKA